MICCAAALAPAFAQENLKTAPTKLAGRPNPAVRYSGNARVTTSLEQSLKNDTQPSRLRCACAGNAAWSRDIAI